ncbi:LOW QUALITY PROTEIN: SAG family member [Eimeria mitis]|uniref:SAG family member n=1 Tax=Eimeria mitis TaxID=44415 RepID=U6K4C5_9EIME|nr:LOW QUALITY PROTEIN: SAG family member [Eimeria mitis]CDJ32534.1 SAG family member [Eimeria mitis]
MRNRLPFPQQKACASLSAVGVQDKHICIRVLRAHCFGVNVPSPCFVFDYTDNHTVTMAPLKLLTVVSSSLFFLAKANDKTPAEQATYTVELGRFPYEGKCLDEVNAARVAAGLSQLTKAVDPTHRLPKKDKPDEGEPDTEWAWQPVCEALIPTKTKSRSSADTEDKAEFQSGTYAYLPIDDPNSVDCKAVVDKWKEAYSNFDGLPPANKEEEDLYDTQENVSFVALYNPSKEATADCRVVTCTQTPAGASSARRRLLQIAVSSPALKHRQGLQVPAHEEAREKAQAQKHRL